MRSNKVKWYDSRVIIVYIAGFLDSFRFSQIVLSQAFHALTSSRCQTRDDYSTCMTLFHQSINLVVGVDHGS